MSPQPRRFLARGLLVEARRLVEESHHENDLDVESPRLDSLVARIELSKLMNGYLDNIDVVISWVELLCRWLEIYTRKIDDDIKFLPANPTPSISPSLQR